MHIWGSMNKTCMYLNTIRAVTIVSYKRDDFNFEIINFPLAHLSSIIPISPAYGIYVSKLVRYLRACSSYADFVKRIQSLSRKLIKQGNVKERLVLFLTKFIGRYQNLADKYSVSTSQLIHDGLDVKIMGTDVVYHLNNVL